MEREPERQQENRSRADAEDLLAVQETLQGRKDAFDRIVERYTPMLYSLAHRTLGGNEDAEEAVQFFSSARSRACRKVR